MKYSEYKFKFYLNANHAIYLAGNKGQNHPHTWEITLDTLKIRNDFVQFDVIEKSVEKFFSEWQDKDINTIPPFDVLNPTLENLCLYFKDEMNRLLGEKGWLLRRIEMSETPARSYIIDLSDEPVELGTAEEQSKPKSVDEAAEEKLEQVLESIH